jgi:hypothetical protein
MSCASALASARAIVIQLRHYHWFPSKPVVVVCTVVAR